MRERLRSNQAPDEQKRLSIMADRDSLPSSRASLPPEALWSKIAAQTDPDDKDFRRALAAGPIPEQLRSSLWMRHAGASRKSKSGVYAALLHAPEAKPGEHAQIALDIGRSGVRCLELQQALSRVLTAFSAHNQNTGYVQGQNFIAAGLLRALPEEEVFWLLATVVEDYLPEHFTPSMAGSFIDCHVLAELLARRLPDISAKLCAMEVSVQLLATRWFLTLWSSVLPPPTLLRALDALFTLGPSATMLVALACLHVMRPAILAAQDAEDFADSAITQRLREVSPDEFVRVLLHEVGDIKPALLEKMRAQQRSAPSHVVGGGGGSGGGGAGGSTDSDGVRPPLVLEPAAAKKPSLSASLQHEVTSTFKRMHRSIANGMSQNTAARRRARPAGAPTGGGGGGATPRLLDTDGTPIYVGEERSVGVHTGDAKVQVRPPAPVEEEGDEDDDPGRVASPEPASSSSSSSSSSSKSEEARAGDEADDDAAVSGNKGWHSAQDPSLSTSQLPPAAAAPPAAAPAAPPAQPPPVARRLPLGKLAANTLASVGRATSFTRGRKKATPLAWPTYAVAQPAAERTPLPRLPTAAEDEAAERAEVARALAVSAIATAIAMVEAEEADATVVEAIAQAVEEDAIREAQAAEAVAAAAEADAIDDILAQVETAAAATPERISSPVGSPRAIPAVQMPSPLALPRTLLPRTPTGRRGNAVRRGSALASALVADSAASPNRLDAPPSSSSTASPSGPRRTELLTLLATIAGIVVGGTTLVASSRRGSVVPPVPPSVQPPVLALPAPSPSSQFPASDAPPCGQRPSSPSPGGSSTPPPTMYYHQGQYYFSCGHSQGARAHDHGQQALFFLNVFHAVLHPFTALRQLAHAAVAASVDGIRGGMRRVVRAFAARLTTNDA